MKLEEEIKSHFRNEYHKALVNIYYTNCVLVEEFQRLLGEYGITPQQFNVLRILRGQHPESVSIGAIRERMLDKNSDVSRIIERLKVKGVVARNESKDDRRLKDVKITAKGLSLLKKMDKCDEQVDAFLSKLSKKEVTQLNDLLDKSRNR